jgi:hypothetical protein
MISRLRCRLAAWRPHRPPADFGRESLERALIDVLGDRRPELTDANLAAFSSGYEASA